MSVCLSVCLFVYQFVCLFVSECIFNKIKSCKNFDLNVHFVNMNVLYD